MVSNITDALRIVRLKQAGLAQELLEVLLPVPKIVVMGSTGVETLAMMGTQPIWMAVPQTVQQKLVGLAGVVAQPRLINAILSVVTERSLVTNNVMMETTSNMMGMNNSHLTNSDVLISAKLKLIGHAQSLILVYAEKIVEIQRIQEEILVMMGTMQQEMGTT